MGHRGHGGAEKPRRTSERGTLQRSADCCAPPPPLPPVPRGPAGGARALSPALARPAMMPLGSWAMGPFDGSSTWQLQMPPPPQFARTARNNRCPERADSRQHSERVLGDDGSGSGVLVRGPAFWSGLCHWGIRSLSIRCFTPPRHSLVQAPRTDACTACPDQHRETYCAKQAEGCVRPPTPTHPPTHPFLQVSPTAATKKAHEKSAPEAPENLVCGGAKVTICSGPRFRPIRG